MELTSAWEIMIFRKSLRILIQHRLAITHGIVWQMRKVQVARLLGLVLLFEVAMVHDGGD